MGSVRVFESLNRTETEGDLRRAEPNRTESNRNRDRFKKLRTESIPSLNSTSFLLFSVFYLIQNVLRKIFFIKRFFSLWFIEQQKKFSFAFELALVDLI